MFATPLVARGAPSDASQRLAALEAETGGRIGLCALDTGSGRRIAWRANERFAMQSSFKWLLAAMVLHRAESGGPALSSAVVPRIASVTGVGHTEQVRPFIGRARTLDSLCVAMMTTSDNGAANTLLREVGGPAALTAYLRGLGDPITRQDTYEPGPAARDGDLTDTTTPAAMLGLMQRVWLGDALSQAGRAKLMDWLRACVVGANRLDAGVPPSWVEGDRTGTGDPGVANDCAIFWPQGVGGARAPILVASYQCGSHAPIARLEARQAAIGRLVADVLG